jgi:hypothetical protein
MKYLKMFGLAAIAAMGLMAFLGAGSASASVLCETTPVAGTHCGTSWHVKAGTVLDFSGVGSTALTGPFGELIATCTESTVKGKTTNTGSTTESVKGTIEALTFTNCGERTVTANPATLGTLEIHHIAGKDNGTVTSNDTTVTITKTPFGTCTFQTANTDIGELTGRTATGKDPIFHISAIIPHESSNFCPNGTWEGKYEYTGTTTFDVAAG